MKTATQFMQDDNGNGSSTRVINLMSYAVVLIMWSIVSYKAGLLQPLPPEILMLLGVTSAAKIAQKSIESKNGSGNGGKDKSSV